LFALSIIDTPAWLFGTLTTLVALWGAIRYVTNRRCWYALFIAGLGTSGALLSKLEFGVATLVLGGILSGAVLWRAWIGCGSGRAAVSQVLLYWMVALVPTGVAYLWIGGTSGFDNLWEGVTGYGIPVASRTICDLWPSGKLLLEGMATLALSVIAGGLVTTATALPFSGSKPYSRSFLVAGVVFAAITILVYLLNIPYSFPYPTQTPFPLMAWAVKNAFIWVKWLTPIAIVIVLVRWPRLFVARAMPSTIEQVFAMLCACNTVIVARAFAMLGYEQYLWPGSFLTGFLMLKIGLPAVRHVLEIMPSRLGVERWPRVLAAGFAIYGLLSLVALPLYDRIVYPNSSVTLQTSRGPFPVSAPLAPDIETVISRILTNTTPSDIVLVVPRDAGLNFVTARQSPLPQIQFVEFALSPQTAAKVKANLEAMPPKLVVVVNQRDMYPYHVCTFPHVTWDYLTRPPSWQEESPAVWQFIRSRYRLQEHIGSGDWQYDLYTPL